MNHCLLEVTVKVAPTIRYTQDNKTAIAEMDVVFDGLREDDPQGSIKVVGWGNLAQELPNRVQVGQKVILEGRLRMNTVPRQDGTKEKKAEFTLSRLHAAPSSQAESATTSNNLEFQNTSTQTPSAPSTINNSEDPVTWNSSPLIPDTDDIPF
ncbi:MULTISPECIES: single-stranded DNA-binding protein [Prochlorococcus]|uniref:Single-stranded DNA-binding protein n=1 Tax=Prochlorococcus marinus (strain SARG / CCMP1375 / SS120) TaxID=167539 RepID=Q7VD81_PROMA|nr:MULTISPECIES: single-stranded DNA-binding protein [Prochlorococcus]AAP99547.1 Single-stranded DNA-binding protein [Prochlorococcus marinus subsp. marinus str. CCMP1375]KGG11180.1 Single-stranded DNA-binding protein [Prochlorococcus marinus str. LG]KGG21518.1 Single-stranded DNA-binding protein [Prochlorococcus marinus str. SS2]KGG23137.1 Single-stranded DNA-binding protein [Prochlorococcus marinus str. SS35]KGG33848.1 Single-stranded DNA-binding protein [Prochlorococcus marinus str. SS51]